MYVSLFLQTLLIALLKNMIFCPRQWRKILEKEKYKSLISFSAKTKNRTPYDWKEMLARAVAIASVTQLGKQSINHTMCLYGWEYIYL